MIDFIFVVEKPASWHYKNLDRHRMHYSFAANLHSSMMTSLSDRLGAGVYFNPKVQMPHGVIKYGVVGMDDLLRDLWTWDSLIVAGRLHKPVHHIVRDPAVMKAAAANLNAAMAASLLLLPKDFSTKDLLECLCGLSYRGDVRVGIAEDRDKVRRIVKGSFEALQELYHPHTQMVFKQRGAHDIVHAAISRIVRRSSLRQALLGGLTAGATKGFTYLSAKVRKCWKGSTDAV
ncbi:hypothetical protein WJX75_005730 [Coccomyxa subellipsoidea]|uniref:Phosphatidate cytidylyltransferase, mitochondrial n=1 Tax=Coccomyxa subellipsoidea TaxID=248742 RepID=A0ABR2YD19_9CHLO